MSIWDRLSNFIGKSRGLSTPKADYSQPVFLVEQLRQESYDREIDEGLSSGMRRHATLDVTGLSEDQLTGLLEDLVEEARDFGLCKLVQVLGFNKEGRRYVIVSGETHMSFQGSTARSMQERMKRLTQGLPVEYVTAHITLPVEGEAHQPVNLGMYGSTGSPAFGIPQHPDAARLRKQEKIY